MLRLTSLLSLALVLLAISPSWVKAQNSTTGGSQVLSQDVDAIINQVLQAWGTPGGVAVAVVRLDEEGQWRVETKGYGNATLDGRPITEDTMFSIGSNSKLFATIAAGLLIHNETLSPRITWDTKMASIIPSWRLQDPIASNLSSISDAMAHRTGLPRHDMMFSLNDTAETVLERVQYLPPSFEFREQYQYNNIMYMALSLLPTNLLPERPPFARYVKEHIFEPLGLNGTTYSFDVANATGFMADGLTRQGVNFSENIFAMGTPRPVPFFAPIGGEDGHVVAGPGGVIMSIRDAATWLQTLLLGGINPHTNESVIPPEVILKVASGITATAGPGAMLFPEFSPGVYGGGQVTSSYRGHIKIEHGGDVNGFHSQIARFPNDNLGVAVFTNDDVYGVLIMEAIKYILVDAALGLEPIDWDTRYRTITTFLIPDPAATPRPSSPSLPSVNVTTIAGTYSNDGYGSAELCYVNSVGPGTTQFCTDLINSINEQIPQFLANLDSPTFVSKWNKAFAPYILLKHFDGDIFNATGFTIYPTGDPDEPYYTYPDVQLFYPWVYAELGTTQGGSNGTDTDAEIVGFGLFGVWGAEGEPLPREGNLQERAEVWFTKV
ncbi:hypothetical protein AX16_010001 [Volvariella volvacea WC 439]|nr:hypothetical protein AX16_010001 [Volvariella volvacea WC 439]